MHKPLTFEEAREYLGLLPFDEFAKQQQERYVKEYERLHYDLLSHTGRTTRILLEMVIESQHSNVCIEGYNLSYSYELMQKAKRMAQQLGLDPSRIQKCSNFHSHSYYKHIKVFVDHRQ